MDILLTFTGFHDPYYHGLNNEQLAGPILSLVGEMEFDHTVLFSTPNTDQITNTTKTKLEALRPGMSVEIKHLSLHDPTDYFAILRGLRSTFAQINETYAGASYYVSVASGTPQMHACWFLLAASGEIPTHFLQTRPKRFVTADQPAISMIDLTDPAFPKVRANVLKLEFEEDSTRVAEVLERLEIIGDHSKYIQAVETAINLAQYDVPVLILGETGAGKEVISRLIHDLSNRASKPFVEVNCAALPEMLAESTLFGHVRGSFTGAVSNQDGKFVEADGGTLFLDELGDLPPSVQVKLLRVLEDGKVTPLGGKVKKVNVRIVAATNKDLPQAIAQKTFREDLFYRLNTGIVKLPPLRERIGDIPKLALYFLDKFNRSLRKPKRLSPDAITSLQRHSWPGNVRELKGVIESSAIQASKDLINVGDLRFNSLAHVQYNVGRLPELIEGFNLTDFLDELSITLREKALELSGGNPSAAARLLGITPQAMSQYMKRHQLMFK